MEVEIEKVGERKENDNKELSGKDREERRDDTTRIAVS